MTQTTQNALDFAFNIQKSGAPGSDGEVCPIGAAVLGAVIKMIYKY